MSAVQTPKLTLTDEARAVQLPAIKDFQWSETDEPHCTRRRLILAKYPQVTRRKMQLCLLCFCAFH
jgi:hypothetical protein